MFNTKKKLAKIDETARNLLLLGLISFFNNILGKNLKEKALKQFYSFTSSNVFKIGF